MAARKPRPVRRQPTPRDTGELPSSGMVVFVAIVLAISLVASLWICRGVHVETEAEQRPTRLKTHDSLSVNYTYDGEAIRWYVMVDPDTQVQYLVNDRGGTCPRYDKYGAIMGVTYGE